MNLIANLHRSEATECGIGCKRIRDKDILRTEGDDAKMDRTEMPHLDKISRETT